MPKKKRYPIQKQIHLRQSVANANGLIQANKILSQTNKRLYRQGRFYQIKIELDQSSLSANPIEVYALRDTWGNHKAYQMAYDVYRNTTAEERSRLSKGSIARWEDFRVAHGVTLANSEFQAQVYDEGMNASALTVGEFLNTQVEDKSGNTMIFTWGPGAAGSSYGIVAEYTLRADTEIRPDSGVGEDVPYDQQMEDTSNVETQTLKNRGNSPPYAQNSFGDVWEKVTTLRALPGEQRLSTGFFTAPCGLVVIKGLSGSVTTPVFIEFKKGDYKGVDAPSMLEA